MKTIRIIAPLAVVMLFACGPEDEVGTTGDALKGVPCQNTCQNTCQNKCQAQCMNAGGDGQCQAQCQTQCNPGCQNGCNAGQCPAGFVKCGCQNQYQWQNQQQTQTQQQGADPQARPPAVPADSSCWPASACRCARRTSRCAAAPPAARWARCATG